MRRFLVGLIIGRFQPFHYGHSYLFRQAFTLCDNLIVSIGSSNRRNAQNPFTYTQRKRMLELFFQKEKVTHRILKLFPTKDTPDDSVWLQNILQHAGKFDVVVGDNEWVNNIFENAGYNVIRIGYYKRDLYEGKKIRNLLATHASWGKYSPPYIADMIPKRT